MGLVCERCGNAVLFDDAMRLRPRLEFVCRGCATGDAVPAGEEGRGDYEAAHAVHKADMKAMLARADERSPDWARLCALVAVHGAVVVAVQAAMALALRWPLLLSLSAGFAAGTAASVVVLTAVDTLVFGKRA